MVDARLTEIEGVEHMERRLLSITNDNSKEKRKGKKIFELIVFNVPSFAEDNTFNARGKLLTTMTNVKSQKKLV